MEISAMPSCVPPNQTQPRSPLRSGMMLAAWFCTQGDGRKVSARAGSLAGCPTRPDLSMTGAGFAVAGISRIVVMDLSRMLYPRQRTVVGCVGSAGTAAGAVDGLVQPKARSMPMMISGLTAAMYMLSMPYGLPSAYQTVVARAAPIRP